MSKNRILRLVDYDKLFHESLGAKVINSGYAASGQAIGDHIKSLFYQIDSDLGFVPSCECQEFRGTYFLGYVCPYCGTVVSSQFANNLANVNWVGIPDNMPDVLHPVFYCVMREWIGKAKRVKNGTSSKSRGRKVSLIESILNPKEELPLDVQGHIKKQGFTYFREHYEEIMDFLLNKYRGAKFNKMTPYVRKMYKMYKDRMFTNKLPILHPSLHPLAREGKMKAIDQSAGLIMPTLTDLAIAAFSSKRCITSSRYIDNTLWKSYSKYIVYLETIITKKLGDKYAHLRRHAIGARTHYSARGVIVPIVERHMSDEIHLPWSIALNGLKNEILNVLMNREGYVLNDALAKFMRALTIFDEHIYDIVNMLIKECPFKGIPILVGRNPTFIAALCA